MGRDLPAACRARRRQAESVGEATDRPLHDPAGGQQGRPRWAAHSGGQPGRQRLGSRSAIHSMARICNSSVPPIAQP